MKKKKNRQEFVNAAAASHANASQNVNAAAVASAN